MKKKGTLEDRAFVVLDEKSVELSDVSQHDDEDGPRRIPGYLSIQGGEESTVIQERLGQGREYFHNDDTALVSQATGILMESIKIRLSYIDEAIGQLTILFRENPKMKVPLELTMARYDEWVRTNQRLFELNSQLYDLEKRKFTTGRKKVAARRAESTREDVLAMSKFGLNLCILYWEENLVSLAVAQPFTYGEVSVISRARPFTYCYAGPALINFLTNRGK